MSTLSAAHIGYYLRSSSSHGTDNLQLMYDPSQLEVLLNERLYLLVKNPSSRWSRLLWRPETAMASTAFQEVRSQLIRRFLHHSHTMLWTQQI